MIVERHGFVPKLEMVEFWKLTEGIITLGIVSMVRKNWPRSWDSVGPGLTKQECLCSMRLLEAAYALYMK